LKTDGFIAEDTPEVWKVHISSETKVEVRNPMTGRTRRVWKQIGKHNHLLDCECMAIVGAALHKRLKIMPAGLTEEIENNGEGKPASQKGMTPVGIARARDLINGVKFSPDTVRRMKAFFDRHEVDKKGETWDEQGKGWQAWNGWGGDAGYSWAKKVVGQMESRDKNLSEPQEETALASSDGELNPCGMKDDGTFDDENSCSSGYGRPKLVGGYSPKRPGGKIPKQAPKPQPKPQPPTQPRPNLPKPPAPPKGVTPEPKTPEEQERSRIEEKMRKPGVKFVILPKNMKNTQHIEKSFDNIMAKGYEIPPPYMITTERLTGRWSRAYAISSNSEDRSYQAITFNSKYFESDKYLQMKEQGVKDKWSSAVDTFGHEYGHALHAKDVSYEQWRTWKRGKFGSGKIGALKKSVAKQVSDYAMKNPQEFVAETFAGNLNGKKYSKEVYAMYKEYKGPTLK